MSDAEKLPKNETNDKCDPVTRARVLHLLAQGYIKGGIEQLTGVPVHVVAQWEEFLQRPA